MAKCRLKLPNLQLIQIRQTTWPPLDWADDRTSHSNHHERTRALLLMQLKIWPVLSTVVLMASTGVAEEPGRVSFSREVLPILSDRCFHCHGPDPSHRKAKLRLDLEDDVKRDRDGSFVVAPGDLKASELWSRLITDDEDDLMPPADSHRKSLTETERDLIRRWIEEGAEWGTHWAFEKPARPAVPDLATHPIDAFVKANLQREGLVLSPPAPSHTQLRRLSFSLTGLPPTSRELEQWESDPSPEAWEAAIERLLNSPHHGERLAMWWLDAARYSETDGYQLDLERSNWPWRDWVVDAFNRNMPFDQFTIEQFAGDLLPDATPEQVLATCFHRNHMTNGEGGRDPEESRIDYVIDRVNTTGTVWLGLTLGCTQCHSHKFDPVSHKDYYSLFAFFNSIDEDGKAGKDAKPYLKYESPHAKRAVDEIQKHVATWKPLETKARSEAEARFGIWLDDIIPGLPHDYRAWHSLQPKEVHSVEGTTFRIENDGTVQTGGPNLLQDDYHVTFVAPKGLTRITGWKLEVLPDSSHTDGKLSRGATGEFILTNVKLLVRKKGESQVRDIEMTGAIADFESKPVNEQRYGKVKDTLDDDPRNGWTTGSGNANQAHTAVFEFSSPLVVQADEELTFVLLHRSTNGHANIGRFRISASDQTGETVSSLKVAPLEEVSRARIKTSGEVPPELRKRLLAQYLLDDLDYQTILGHLQEAERQMAEIRKSTGKLDVMVLAESEKIRDTHVLVRGVWDDKGDQVSPGVLPAVLPWPENKSKSRLDLAKWLVDSDNPLTARVVVNHLWGLVFGEGLVRTPEDFGHQGENPTHPELLDWLAVELVENDWDLRHILRLITTSDTFRQSSTVTPELLERDPENRLLARSPRFRLPAWMIRDNALRAAGLLNPAIGGPPVKPWQPEGVWNEIFMGRFTYKPSVGPAQYRRTLYAYWRRSSAPTFLFDSAQRRVCEVGTRRTNTPLQALTLLNDTTMLESSRVLADLVMGQEGDRLETLSWRMIGRSLTDAESTVISRAQTKALDYYRSHPDQAVSFSTVGQQPEPSIKVAPNIASWMTVASMMLNLDEAMTHE